MTRTHCRRPFAIASLLALSTLGSCLAERENTLMRAARVREARALQDERDRLVRQVAVLQQTHADATRQLGAADAQAIETAAELRAVRADLQFRLQQLVQAEQDLAAAEARAKQIEAQLVPLRALEATLTQLEAQRAAAQQKLVALQQEVAAAEAAAQQGEAELSPRLQAAKARLAAVQKASTALATAEAALAEALASLAPPPAQPPAQK